VYGYRCETATRVPRLDASGVARWCLTYRRRHPRRSGHLHVRGNERVTRYSLPVMRLTSTCFTVMAHHRLRCPSRCVVCPNSRTFCWEQSKCISRDQVVTTVDVYFFLYPLSFILSTEKDKRSFSSPNIVNQF